MVADNEALLEEGTLSDDTDWGDEEEETGWDESEESDEEEGADWGDSDEEEDWGDSEESDEDEEADWGESEEDSDDEEDADWSGEEDDSEPSDEDAQPEEGIAADDDTREDYAQALNNSDSLESAIRGMSGGFTEHYEEVELKDLVLQEFVKHSRVDTHLGVTQGVRELGLIQPIVVTETAAYARWLAEGSKGIFEGKKYYLIDGLRRVYSMIKLEYKKAMAIMVSFDDPDKGNDMIMLFRCLFNKHERMSWRETWGYLQVLDSSFALSSAVEEYLLGLNGGDVAKLKDIMGNADKYPEIVDNLYSDKKTLDQSYSALNKARKEENRLAQDDAQGISGVDEAQDVVDDNSGSTQGLSDEETVKKLEMDSVYDATGNFGDSDFANGDAGSSLAMSPEDYGGQKVHERHPLDPAIKNAVLRRDDFKCVACGTGGTPFLGALVVHHPVPVYAGGKDVFESPVFLEDEERGIKLNPENNLVTLCDTCHLALHSIAMRMGGKIPMTKEEFEGFSDNDKERLRRLKLFVEIEHRCDEKLGRKQKDLRISHRKPWEGVEDMVAAYNNSSAADAKPLIGKVGPDLGEDEEGITEEEETQEGIEPDDQTTTDDDNWAGEDDDVVDATSDDWGSDDGYWG